MINEPLRLKLNLAEEIQLSYPIEPAWDEVDNETLVALVENFASEPSCATMAIGFLARRQYPSAIRLARWLLNHEHADQWLKSAARDVLKPD